MPILPVTDSGKTKDLKDTDLIMVCDNCQQASCWQGAFICDDAREAGVMILPVATLKKLGYENADWWKFSMVEV